ncbi:MAG: hypothetical protein A2Y60_01140 [Chloroflexi bacterium RBG_13_54_9]|nr:MAG: hypothetical protein A2Y60_01140 [Chloroflexi bacterium RBG_13_54_9]
MKSDFLVAITQLSAEKNLPREVVFQVVEAALASAFKKDESVANQNISVKILPTTGEMKVYVLKSVVEKPADSNREISLDEAIKVKVDAKLGDTIEVETFPRNAGRIAAQTAKQVVLQRLREAEREVVFEEYADKESDIVSGIVQRIEPKQIIIDLGRAEAVLPVSEQVQTEHYRVGRRLKLVLTQVFRTNKGPQLVVSRSHPDLLRRLFELEVPEIYNGIVELKSVAREAGHRSKVAVAARQAGVDPVGSCVGVRGIRIQNIVNELNGERIDVVQWDPNPATFVGNALSPAQVSSVEVDEGKRIATVAVPDRQLSLAIGKEGQNARLAAKLTGWRIDIKSLSVAEAERAAKEAEAAAAKSLAEAVTKEKAIEELVPLPAAPAAAPVSEAVAEELEIPAVTDENIEAELGKVTGLEEELKEIASDLLVEPEAPREPAQIRFAEEILAPKSAKADTKGKKGKKKKGWVAEEEEKLLEIEATPKPKQGRKRRGFDTQEEEDEYAYLGKIK